jgi:hypothetical protein
MIDIEKQDKIRRQKNEAYLLAKKKNRLKKEEGRCKNEHRIPDHNNNIVHVSKSRLLNKRTAS